MSSEGKSKAVYEGVYKRLLDRLLAAKYETQRPFLRDVKTFALWWRWFVHPERPGIGHADGHFPTLTLMQADTGLILFRQLETKRRRGYFSGLHQKWIDALSDGGYDAAVWTPGDAKLIIETLSEEDTFDSVNCPEWIWGERPRWWLNFF